MKENICKAAVALVFAALSTAASAQQATKPPEDGKVTATTTEHGAWKVRCESLREAAKRSGRQVDLSKIPDTVQCAMVQSVKHKERNDVGMSVVVVKNKKGDQTVSTMRIMAPIGVYLPTGVALEIDGAAVGRIGFARCLPQVCVANADVNDDLLKKLEKGGKANFIIYEAPGLGLGMEFSLEGFTAAHDAL